MEWLAQQNIKVGEENEIMVGDIRILIQRGNYVSCN